jgi:ribosomal protein L27
MTTPAEHVAIAAGELAYAARVLVPPAPIPSDFLVKPAQWTAYLLAAELESWSEYWSVVAGRGSSLPKYLEHQNANLESSFLATLGQILATPCPQPQNEEEEEKSPQIFEVQGNYVDAMRDTITAIATALVKDFEVSYEAPVVPKAPGTQLTHDAAQGTQNLPVSAMRESEERRWGSKRSVGRHIQLAEVAQVSGTDGEQEVVAADLDSRQPNHAWNKERLKAAPVGSPVPWAVYAKRRKKGKGWKGVKLLLDPENPGAPRIGYHSVDVEVLAWGTVTVTQRGTRLSAGRAEFSLALKDSGQLSRVQECVQNQLRMVTRKTIEFV